MTLQNLDPGTLLKPMPKPDVAGFLCLIAAVGRAANHTGPFAHAG